MNDFEHRKLEMLAELRAETERAGRRRRARRRAMTAGAMATAAGVVALLIVPMGGPAAPSPHPLTQQEPIADASPAPAETQVVIDRRTDPASVAATDEELIAALEAAGSDLGVMWVGGEAVVLRERASGSGVGAF